MSKKHTVSYVEFLKFKNNYLRDTHPLLNFGKAFCLKFGITDEYIEGALTVASARVRIDEKVEWTF